MTIDEARRELGVDATFNADAVRRAYLRRLKTRKPDVDPDGFQRLREAYEQAARFAPKGKSAASPPKEEDPASPQREETPAPPPKAVAEAVIPPPSPAPSPSFEPATAPPNPVPVAPTPPIQANDPPTVVPRVASCTGAPAIAAREKAGDFVGAAQLAIELLDAGTASLTFAVPPLYLVVRLQLRLHEHREIATARMLDQALRRWLDATGDEARLVRDHLAASLQIARSLGALPSDFDPEVRAIIARGAADGDVGRVLREMASFRRRSPWRAEQAAWQLRKYAPPLAATLQKRSVFGRARPGYIATLVLTLSLVGAVQWFDRPSAGPKIRRRETTMEDAVTVLKNDARNANAPDVVQAASAFGATLGLGDCASARALWDPLDAAVKTSRSGILRRDLNALARSCVGLCTPDSERP